MKIPIIVISGFLGAGKTTLLKRIITEKNIKKILYLVNDFSANDIDRTEVSTYTDLSLSLSGGSIFCDCVITKFISTLETIKNEINPDLVILEASGVTNPLEAERMLEESKMDVFFYLANNITIIDSSNFMQLVEIIPNIKNQVISANLIVMNKTDFVSEDEIIELKKKIQTMNSNAKILKSNFCAIETKVLFESYKNRVLNYVRNSQRFSYFTLKNQKKLRFENLKKLVCANSYIYRVKGWILQGDEYYRVDYSYNNWETKRDINDRSDLDFIYDKEYEYDFKKLIRML